MSTLQLTVGRRFPAVRAYLQRRSVRIAAVVCLLSFTAFLTAQRAADVSMIDLMVYRTEGWTARTGGDLYAMRATHAELPMTYPPFAALLFMPLTLVGVPEMRFLATAANLVLLVALVHLSLRLVGRPLALPRPAAVLAVSAAAVWCEPVWTTLRYGQINLLLAVLVLWDLSRRADHRWAGVGIGVAAGIKLTPALFAVFLALCGLVCAWRRLRGPDGGARRGVWNHWLRRASVAAATFAGTVLLAALVLPRDSRTFWTDALFSPERVGRVEDTANQSLRGALARLLHTADPGSAWTAAAAAAAAAGLAVAVAAALAGPRRLPSAHAWAVVSVACTALLVSPVSWSHHWVWCVPAVLLLGSEALRRKGALWWAGAGGTALLFCSYALWWVPHGSAERLELRQNGVQMALSAVYPAAGAAVLLLAAAAVGGALLRGRPQAATKE
ncbi:MULTISPECIES: glycosyltransferase 87 family protein [Streptomyces]|uniref:Glycosyltransferase 87 family protein n=1 Tax=Streptomyces desertarenae TaxID=2666184 RepID=A0ABW4PE04_9ACTN